MNRLCQEASCKDGMSNLRLKRGDHQIIAPSSYSLLAMYYLRSSVAMYLVATISFCTSVDLSAKSSNGLQVVCIIITEPSDQ